MLCKNRVCLKDKKNKGGQKNLTPPFQNLQSCVRIKSTLTASLGVPDFDSPQFQRLVITDETLLC